jgi:hypothetical protein
MNGRNYLFVFLKKKYRTKNLTSEPCLARLDLFFKKNEEVISPVHLLTYLLNGTKGVPQSCLQLDEAEGIIFLAF